MTLNPEGEKCMLSYDGSCVITPMVEQLVDSVKQETDRLMSKSTVIKKVDKDPARFSREVRELRNGIKGSACENCRWK
jgi:hypothetical protein